MKETDENGETHYTDRMMNAAEYADHVGWNRMAEYIRTRKFTSKEKLLMFNKVYWVGIQPGGSQVAV